MAAARTDAATADGSGAICPIQAFCGAGGIRTHTGRNLSPVPLPLGYGPALGTQRRQTPSSVRSLATWPVAFTAYCACSMLPSGPTTNVDLMTPTDFFPYSIFSP